MIDFREWRINRVRERIAGNKKKLDTVVVLLSCHPTSQFVYDMPRLSYRIGRDQQLLARLQGFAQNYDAELRKRVFVQKKEGEIEN